MRNYAFLALILLIIAALLSAFWYVKNKSVKQQSSKTEMLPAYFITHLRNATYRIDDKLVRLDENIVLDTDLLVTGDVKGDESVSAITILRNVSNSNSYLTGALQENKKGNTYRTLLPVSLGKGVAVERIRIQDRGAIVLSIVQGGQRKNLTFRIQNSELTRTVPERAR